MRWWKSVNKLKDNHGVDGGKKLQHGKVLSWLESWLHEYDSKVKV